ncbi:MAG: Putative membrane protein [Clostridiales bacterium 38_11]|nr:MAG: Putative membrane protein [Clostridiales bacterium 38_11]HBH12926.1 hypothetical protein [Clostridiales bacterium]
MNIGYIQQFFLLMVVGGLGAFIGHRLRIPAGIFIGAIISVGVFQVFFGTIMAKPSWMKLIMQIAVGLVLGTRFTAEVLIDFKKMVKPVLISCVSLIFFAIMIGYFLSYITGWDLLTSILSTAPGGQTEMAILSDSVGADTEKIIILQLVRSQLVLVVMMPLVKRFQSYRGKEVKKSVL